MHPACRSLQQLCTCLRMGCNGCEALGLTIPWHCGVNCVLAPFCCRSSRSHAIFTITVNRTMVDVLNEVGEDMRARVRTSEFVSKLHLVDLAGQQGGCRCLGLWRQA